MGNICQQDRHHRLDTSQQISQKTTKEFSSLSTNFNEVKYQNQLDNQWSSENNTLNQQNIQIIQLDIPIFWLRQTNNQINEKYESELKTYFKQVECFQSIERCIYSLAQQLKINKNKTFICLVDGNFAFNLIENIQPHWKIIRYFVYSKKLEKFENELQELGVSNNFRQIEDIIYYLKNFYQNIINPFALNLKVVQIDDQIVNFQIYLTFLQKLTLTAQNQNKYQNQQQDLLSFISNKKELQFLKEIIKEQDYSKIKNSFLRDNNLLVSINNLIETQNYQDLFKARLLFKILQDNLQDNNQITLYTHTIILNTEQEEWNNRQEHFLYLLGFTQMLQDKQFALHLMQQQYMSLKDFSKRKMVFFKLNSQKQFFSSIQADNQYLSVLVQSNIFVQIKSTSQYSDYSLVDCELCTIEELFKQNFRDFHKKQIEQSGIIKCFIDNEIKNEVDAYYESLLLADQFELLINLLLQNQDYEKGKKESLLIKGYQGMKKYEEVLKIQLSQIDQNKNQQGAKYQQQMNHLALTYRSLNQLEQCISCHKKSLESRRNILQEDSIIYAQYVQSLGNSYHYFKNFIEALENHQKALDIREKLKADKSIISQTYKNIGLDYYQLNQFEKALECFEKACSIDEELNMQVNNFTAYIYGQISQIYFSMNKIEKNEEGEKYLLKQFSVKVELYGKQNFKILPDYEKIGFFYKQQNKFKESFEYFEKALEIKISKFGVADERVYTDYLNLVIHSQILNKQNDKNQTILANIEKKMLEKTREQQKMKNEKWDLEFALKEEQAFIQIYGQFDIQLLQIYQRIKDIYKRNNNYEEEANYQLKIFETQKKYFNESEPSIFTNLEVVGDIYFKNQQYDRALKYYFQSLHYQEKILEKANSTNSILIKQIGNCFFHQNEYQNALQYYLKCLKIRESFYENNIQSKIQFLLIIVDCYIKLKQFEQAKEYIIQCQNLNHPEKIYEKIELDQKLTECYINLEQYELALNLSQQCISFIRQNSSSHITILILSLEQLALIFQKLEDFNRLKTTQIELIEANKKNYGMKDQKTAKSYENLGDTCYMKNEYKEALQNFLQALKIIDSGEYLICSTLHFKIGDCYFGIKQFQNALENFWKALELQCNKYGLSKKQFKQKYDQIKNVIPNEDIVQFKEVFTEYLILELLNFKNQMPYQTQLEEILCRIFVSDCQLKQIQLQ